MSTTWRQLGAVAALPFVGTVVIPGAILATGALTNPGWGLPVAVAWLPILLGCGLLAVGLALFVRTVALFTSVGRGTLAPWDPPRRLVVRGPYQHVRNPMISAVLFILLGEAAVLGSPSLLYWFIGFFAVNALYIPIREEPQLARRFGDDYRTYRRHVPRWIPRPRAWTAPWAA